MAPINLPDGTEVSTVTMPDGTEASEVRDPDGNVVFSAIRDSVTNRWKLDEGSGTGIADSIDSQAATASADDWISASKYTGGAAYNFDASDNYWATDSQFGINGSDGTVMGWFSIDSANNDFSRVWCTPDTVSPGNTTESGYTLETRSGPELELIHWDNGSNTTIANASGLSLDTDYFVANTFNGDSGTLYVYDSSQQIFSSSGTGARNQTDQYLRVGVGGESGGDGVYFGGIGDDVFASTSTEMPESEIETVWQETLR